jgi:Chromate transporter
MGLITPGPVVITAGFIGYLVAGLPGAVIATVAIFTPIYLAVVIPGRWFIRHRDNNQVKAFVAGATAAAAGALSGAVVILTREAVTDWTTAAIALASLALLWRFKINEPYIVTSGPPPLPAELPGWLDDMKVAPPVWGATFISSRLPAGRRKALLPDGPDAPGHRCPCRGRRGPGGRPVRVRCRRGQARIHAST